MKVRILKSEESFKKVCNKFKHLILSYQLMMLFLSLGTGHMLGHARDRIARSNEKSSSNIKLSTVTKLWPFF